MRTGVLLEVAPTRKSLAVRISEFKKDHNIWTHYTKELPESPWMAILLNPDETRHPIEVVAAECRLYDESGRMAEGKGELTVIRELCAKNKIRCDL